MYLWHGVFLKYVYMYCILNVNHDETLINWKKKKKKKQK